MRGYLAPSIGVACAAVLTLPLAVPATAAPPAAARTTASARTTAVAPGRATEAVPGATQSLPLAPVARTRGAVAGAVAAERGLPRRDVRSFSLLGVVWNDPGTELHGRVQVRTRAAGTADWSGWQDVETHNHEHAPDPGTAESRAGRAHGSTAPLWVGDSDGVEVRVRAEATRSRALALPDGLRVELVDPGVEAGSGVGAGPATRAAVRSGSGVPEAAVLPALSRRETVREAVREAESGAGAGAPAIQPFIGPRPRIVTRRGWGADEGLRESGYVYTGKVKAAFVHHTATGNGYKCSQAASVIRGIYRYHVLSSGWRDIGYNFLVDKCGTIYEGRAGGVTKPVLGAHTLGFNTNSMGIAVLGTFTKSRPAAAALKAIARLTAWKLGLYGANPRGKTYLKSAGGNLYRKGKNVRLNVISGHRDGFATECPGRLLYGKLGSARSTAARYQGRR
ncbi:N-acetylmuramoyl-L-alanine amidase family 2 [Actinobacteria bacterium OK074]|nr:N-acetylmuramoyl-L-alanine amidase family 2 [Actinobacteria bacterium OK074]